MSKLELILLGRFECLLSPGEQVTLAMRKAEVLLAFLALSPGLRHPRERLINLLWSDRGEDQARNSLRQCLSAIRKSLGEAADLALQIDRTTVCLNAEVIEVDVLEFERLAAGEYESLVTAADLYQGEFLEGIAIRDAACQEWLDSERDRFRRQFIEILYNLAETQLVSHDYGNAIRSAERLVEQDPLAEAGWRLLMQSYSAKGDRSHALQAFKRCQQTLRKELEVDPEQATVELRDRIAGGDPRPAPAVQKPVPRDVDVEHSIVVLPFDNLSGDPEQEYFSDGITDSIIMNLALFPGLQVKSRNSSFAFKEQIKSIGEISSELGVDYLVEGSVRRSSGRIRVNVQLIDSVNGNQVWGKRYDAEIDDLFELEEDLSRTIAATVTGQIESVLQRFAISGQAADQQSYDLLLAGNYYLNLGDRANVLLATEAFNRCLSIDPDNARVHANLFYCHDFNVMDHWSDDIEDSRRLAAEHIKKAVSMAPDLPYVQVAYANYLIFNRQQFEEAERQLQLALGRNPNDTEAISMRAVGLNCQGQAEAALEQAELALRLDPYHPWARWPKSEALFFCGRYEECIATIESAGNAPGYIRIYAVAANVELGRGEQAGRALESYLEFSRSNMRPMPRNIDEWRDYYRYNAPFTEPSVNDRIIDLLIDAGLDDTAAAESAIDGDGTDHAPSIAVLPFENLSGDPEQEFFSDGITSDIISTLSKIRNMRIVARHSTLQYKTEKASLAEIAEQQDVRYILEGSVRKSGDRIRVNAELIDVDSRQNCWSERYDRDLDDLFAVQDDITKNIVVAMKVYLTDGERSARRSAGTQNLKAWELALLAIDLQDTYIYQNILESRAMCEQAIKLDPDYCYAWVVLGWTHWQEAYSGWCESFNASMQAAEAAATRALELDPENGEAWSLAGTIHIMNHEPDKVCEANRKALELEPGNAEVQVLAGFAMNFLGETDRAWGHFQHAMRLCPVCPNWYYLVGSYCELARNNIDKAIELLRQGVAVMPDSPLIRFYLAAVLLEHGGEAEARRLAGEIRQLDESMTGKGLVRSYSKYPAERDRLQRNFESLGLA